MSGVGAAALARPPVSFDVPPILPGSAPTTFLAVTIDMFDPQTPEDFRHFFFQAVVFTSGGRLVTEPQHTIVLHPSL